MRLRSEELRPDRRGRQSRTGVPALQASPRPFRLLERREVGGEGAHVKGLGGVPSVSDEFRGFVAVAWSATRAEQAGQLALGTGGPRPGSHALVAGERVPPLADGEPETAGRPRAGAVGRRTIRAVIRTGERGAR